MRRTSHQPKVTDSPSAKGGALFWLCLALIVLLAGSVKYSTRSAASSPTGQPAGVAPVSTVATSREHYRGTVFENPQADRWAVFAQDLAQEPDPGKREDRMVAWLVDVKPDEIPALLAFLQSATPAELALDLSKRLTRRWTDADPAKAAAWVETLPPDQQLVMLDDVAIVWANNDPTNAMKWAGSLADNAARCQALATVAGEAVRSQPLMALQIAIDLPAGEQRDDLIQRGARQWASTDVDRAVAWVSQIPTGDLRNQTLSGVAIVWSASEPVAAATWALHELPPGRLLDDTVISIVQRWAQQKPEDAAAWVEQFPSGSLQATAVANVSAIWHLQDGASADAWRESLKGLAPVN